MGGRVIRITSISHGSRGIREGSTSLAADNRRGTITYTGCCILETGTDEKGSVGIGR